MANTASANKQHYSIVLVDDDEDDRLIIDEAFIKIGYEPQVMKFSNGKGLLDYLAGLRPGHYPSLIVLDNTLPGLDALDILTLVKKEPYLQSIPVVIYTTVMSPAKKEALMKKGAFRCIQKGSLMNDVVEIAKELRDIAESSKENNNVDKS